MQLHTRATWSAREDRRITLLWLGLFLAIVLVGFGFDLTNYLHETPAVPKWFMSTPQSQPSGC